MLRRPGAVLGNGRTGRRAAERQHGALVVLLAQGHAARLLQMGFGERREEGARRRQTVLHPLGQRPHQHRVKRRIQAGLQFAGRGGHGMQDLVHHHRRRARERPHPGQHLVQQDAGGENVGAAIHPLAAKLLGRHVAGRADHIAHLGQRGRLDLGHAEIGHLDLGGGRDEYVGRLDIAVHHPARMRVVERAQELRHAGNARA